MEDHHCTLPEHRPYLRRKKGVRVEILPLIDVMFLLVSFFVVSTVSMVLERGIPLNLAQGVSGEHQTEQPKAIIVSVDADGGVFIDKDRVRGVELEGFLARISRHSGEKDVILRADKDARHEQVIRVLDSIRRSGLTKVVIALEPSEGD